MVIIISVVLLVLAVVNWYFVFNHRERRKGASFTYYFFRMNREERNMSDALALATHVIVGTVCSVFLFAIIFLTILQTFK
jgi:hypothetical protein